MCEGRVNMRTNDIVKLGINRNFIRECERQGLINPNRTEGIMVINENYHHREYSDSDLQIIWGSMLLRKMDVSFSDIKKWYHGENISIRNQINATIKKCEREIEELQTTVDFMKHFRATGVLPRPPQTINKVNNFKDYVNEYLKDIDPKGDKKKFYDFIHRELELKKIPKNELTEQQKSELKMIEIEKNKTINYYLKTVSPSDIEFIIELDKMFIEFGKVSRQFDFDSEQTRNIIREIYYFFKKNSSNDFTPFVFACIMFILLEDDTDLGEYILGGVEKETIEYFFRAVLEFARNEDSESLFNK